MVGCRPCLKLPPPPEWLPAASSQQTALDDKRAPHTVGGCQPLRVRGHTSLPAPPTHMPLRVQPERSANASGPTLPAQVESTTGIPILHLYLGTRLA